MLHAIHCNVNASGCCDFHRSLGASTCLTHRTFRMSKKELTFRSFDNRFGEAGVFRLPHAQVQADLYFFYAASTRRGSIEQSTLKAFS